MVNNSLSPEGLLRFTIENVANIAKTRNPETCEDKIYIGPYFVAVIDGATSKTDKRWEGKTGGRVGAEILWDTFTTIPYDATARQATDLLTAAIQTFYEEHHATQEIEADPVKRISACFVAASLWRKEIWFVGDCQCMVDQNIINNKKAIDTVTSNARAVFLESEICKGSTIDGLLQDDRGREFILPLLERQILFQNNPQAGEYWYPVIDGSFVPDEGIRIVSLPEHVESIVLASDGYPILKEGLEESEKALAEILHDDPLLFRKYKTTKGVKSGQVSFDDRTYVRLKVQR